MHYNVHYLYNALYIKALSKVLPRFPMASGCTVSALCHHCYYTQCLFAVSTVTQLLRSLRYFAQSVGEMALQCDATSTVTMSRGSHGHCVPQH